MSTDKDSEVWEWWDQHNDEWALPIGRFIVSFTNLEYWTLLCIKVFGSLDVRNACAELPMEPRTKIAQALMFKYADTVEQRQRTLAVFDEIRRLGAQRNLIAHNPPMHNVYLSDKGEMKILRELRSQRNEKKQITKRELAILHRKAVQMGEELHGLLKELTAGK